MVRVDELHPYAEPAQEPIGDVVERDLLSAIGRRGERRRVDTTRPVSALWLVNVNVGADGAVVVDRMTVAIPSCCAHSLPARCPTGGRDVPLRLKGVTSKPSVESSLTCGWISCTAGVEYCSTIGSQSGWY